MAVLLVKGIKPKKLEVDKIRQNILKALEREGKIVIAEYNKTVATWNDPPQFEALVDVSGSEAAVLVGPTGSELQVNKFVWTDQGTKPHTIAARNAPRLIFREGFSPKTLPGVIASYPGGTFGALVGARAVRHPGTKPRRFTAIIQRKRLKPFRAEVLKAARVTYR